MHLITTGGREEIPILYRTLLQQLSWHFIRNNHGWRISIYLLEDESCPDKNELHIYCCSNKVVITNYQKDKSKYLAAFYNDGHLYRTDFVSRKNYSFLLNRDAVKQTEMLEDYVIVE